MATFYIAPVVVLDVDEYENLIDRDKRNRELIGIYLNALHYMVRLHHPAEQTTLEVSKLLKQFGLSEAD